jgi:hypothetical protein
LQRREDREGHASLGDGDFFTVMNDTRNIRKMIPQISNRRSFHMREKLSWIFRMKKVKFET